MTELAEHLDRLARQKNAALSRRMLGENHFGPAIRWQDVPSTIVAPQEPRP